MDTVAQGGAGGERWATLRGRCASPTVTARPGTAARPGGRAGEGAR
ncbi:DUF6380 family protein [Streptomyces cinereospinus]|uniref:DUF6380 family protein n=1 Tax=Streptomyces cinereospinus TaxID=285561 RepID=A0ABV5N0I3_9ACTN